MRLPRLRPDLTPLRDSRDFRLVVIGSFLSGLGAQATLVALPYQVYIQTRSALLVGLLGAVELVPLVAAALLGGAVADRVDRRRLLLLDQIGLVLTAAGLAVGGRGSAIPESECCMRWRRCWPRSSRSRASSSRRSCRTSSTAASYAARSRSRTV